MRAQVIILVILGLAAGLQSNAQRHEHAMPPGQVRTIPSPAFNRPVMPMPAPAAAPRPMPAPSPAPQPAPAPSPSPAPLPAPVPPPTPVPVPSPSAQAINPPVVVPQPRPSGPTQSAPGPTTQHQWHHGQVGGAQNYEDHHQGHHNHHRHHQDQNSTSVVYPYYPYGYYYNYEDDYNDYNDAEYPNSYYICYQIDQTDNDTYHINCPMPVRWYSTNPSYTSYDYESRYRPEFVCQDNNASDYLEFATSYDAITWANNHCNRDLEQNEIP